MKYLYLFLLLTFSIFIQAQEKLDHIWLFGYNTVSDSSYFGGSVMDFNDDTLVMYSHDREMELNETNASICDEEGNLLFYTNGVYIANAQHDTIENGGCCLNPGNLVWLTDANTVADGALILPYPDHPKEYFVFHMGLRLVHEPFLDIAGGPLFYSHVDMNANDEEGLVLEKNVPIVTDSLDGGKLTATRHANGRDWWITVPQFRSNLMYKMLFTPEGIELSSQEIGEPIANGLGQAVFAPDGSVYANVTLNGYVDCAVHIYRFDRCSGAFSDPVRIPVTCSAASAGVAISPNSRYLYVDVYKWIYQIDLWSDDWEASMQLVAEYDGYEEPIPGFDSLTLPTRFFLAQLAPDGKIYINTTNSVRSLHVINQPNLPGDSCDIQQHAIQLPTLNAFSLPNFPNYKLRNEVGSACDTLGPLSLFSQQPDNLAVQFWDESAKQPTTWHWDFGDGDTSILQNPVHVYEQEGVYEVCLRVSNIYGEDEYCEPTMVVVGSEEATQADGFRVFPNPFSDGFYLVSPDGWPGNSGYLELYDALGQRVLLQSLKGGQHQIRAAHLPKGVYLYMVKEQGVVVAQGKLVRQ